MKVDFTTLRCQQFCDWEPYGGEHLECLFEFLNEGAVDLLDFINVPRPCWKYERELAHERRIESDARRLRRAGDSSGISAAEWELNRSSPEDGSGS